MCVDDHILLGCLSYIGESGGTLHALALNGKIALLVTWMFILVLVILVSSYVLLCHIGVLLFGCVHTS